MTPHFHVVIWKCSAASSAKTGSLQHATKRLAVKVNTSKRISLNNLRGWSHGKIPRADIWLQTEAWKATERRESVDCLPENRSFATLFLALRIRNSTRICWCCFVCLLAELQRRLFPTVAVAQTGVLWIFNVDLDRKKLITYFLRRMTLADSWNRRRSNLRLLIMAFVSFGNDWYFVWLTMTEERLV